MSLHFESPEDGMDASFVAPVNKEGKAQLRALRDWLKGAGCTTLVTKMSKGSAGKFYCLVVKFPEAEEDDLDDDSEDEAEADGDSEK
jgi:hypothetical protein